MTSGFPRQEMFGMTNQLRRAAVSVTANIAEGNSRSTGKDKARFFEIAYGSVHEIVAMLRVAGVVGFAKERDFSSLCAEAAVICRMLSGLKRAVLPTTTASKPRLTDPQSLITNQGL
jgi:four helix bundle protein